MLDLEISNPQKKVSMTALKTYAGSTKKISKVIAASVINLQSKTNVKFKIIDQIKDLFQEMENHTDTVHKKNFA